MANKIPNFKPNLKSLQNKNISSNTNHQYKCSTITKTARSKLAMLRNINSVLNVKIGKLENNRNLLLGKVKDTRIKYFANKIGRVTSGIHNMQ